jgi:hypothetical protein
MVKSLPLYYFSITIAILALAISFATAGFIWGIIIAFIIGAAWILSIWRGWRSGGILSMFCLIFGISAAALQEDGSRVALLISTVATLATWDLSAFASVLNANENIAAKDDLIRNHLLRLSSVLILGIALPLIAFALQFDLKFWQAFLLGVVLLIGLSQVFTQLKRSQS